MAARRVLSVSITSLFCVPEQGMTKFEVLSRASGFCVRTAAGEGSRAEASSATARGADAPAARGALRFLGPAHVTHPFKYPGYYPPDEFGWLEHVNASHVRVKLEVRAADGTGAALMEVPFAPGCVDHPERDVVCLWLHPGIEEAMFGALAGAGVELVPQVLSATSLADAAAAGAGAGADAGGAGPLRFHGHTVVPRLDGATGDDVGAQVPCVVPGSFHSSNGPQTFCSTDTELVMGMCGGPVVRARCADGAGAADLDDVGDLDEGGDGAFDGAASECVGMVEGTVPRAADPQHPAFELGGKAAIIDAPLLTAFLRSVG